MRHQPIVIIFALAVLGGSLIAPDCGRAAAAMAIATESQSAEVALYGKHCASCHGKDGRSKTFKAKFNKARNLTEPGWQDAVSDERIFNSIANGRGKMPAFSKKLNDAQIESLVSLVRSLKNPD